ncbi:MAG TPA: ABC transporter ATP-binding protein [Spirochaetia bacterium]|nr:ABC transporter ATP-binding protein [Spirochaetia bacterium]
MAFLELEHIEKDFGAAPVVSDLSLEVQEGEFVAFLGGSGCGKTTTLRMIAGFEVPTRGRIRIDGQDVVNVAARHRNIGMVFQNYALFPNMTAFQNIAFGLSIASMAKADIRTRVQEMLALVHMEEFAGRYPQQLSGGQQQRVALARALAIRPKMLLLDEPLSALDARIRTRLREEIRQIQRAVGITTVYVTHDQEEALSISDRVVVMDRGKIEQVGTPKEIYDTPATRHVASFIGTLNMIEATVSDARSGALDVGGVTIRTAAPIRAADGTVIHAAVRPERISPSTGAEGDNRLSGSVTETLFLGSTVRLVVRAHGRRLSVDLFNDPDLPVPQIGSAITLSFAPEACIPIHASPAHRSE